MEYNYKITRENLHQSCRICLYIKDDMQTFFPSEFVQQLQECTGIDASPDHRLPSKICSTCANLLTSFHSFYNGCHRANTFLKSFIEVKQEIKTEKEYDPFHSDNDTSTSFPCKDENAQEINSIEMVKVEESDHESSRLKMHNEGGTFICSLCNRKFSSKSSLKLHMTRIHLNKRQKTNSRQTCENCGKTFSTGKNLKIHMRIHTGEMPYECKICLRRFTQIGTLISHKRLHTGEKPYVCKLCGRAFTEPIHLRKHQSVHSEDKPFICNVCGKGLKSQYGLTQHTKLHTNEKEHVCDQCGLSFMTKGNLNQHRRVKHSEKSGQCDICNKIFPDLKDHMVVHTGEKPFKCNLCDKRFSLKHGLVIHNRQHTHADKYKCDVEGCGRTFSARWILDCHIKKHTGDMPFSCKFCSKSYPRICHLTQHMKLIHPNEEQNSTSVIGNK